MPMCCHGRMRSWSLAVSSTMLAGLLAVSPAAAAPDAAPEPRVYGGVIVTGSAQVVALALYDKGAWSGRCSAVMLRPRVLLTAAHCVTKAGTGTGVDGFAVFPPGAPAVVYSNTGPQGAGPAHVQQWWTTPGYVNVAGRVQPNDLAVLLLDRDLGPAAYSRLATTAELTRWMAEAAVVEHQGYGSTAPGRSTQVPNGVSLPLVSFNSGSFLGAIFSTAQTASQGLCPGDSGGPVFRSDPAGILLLGVEVGSNSPCMNPPSSTLSNIGVAASSYLALINPALSAAGHPTIPSAPGAVSAAAVNSDVTVSWQPPALSPETVVGYDVVDTAGTLVCQSTTTTCTVLGLPDGTHVYSVRSRNAEFEGNALPAAAAAVVASPPRMSAPVVRRSGRHKVAVTFRTIDSRTSATVSGYVASDTDGRVRCAVETGGRETARMSCSFTARQGTYRLRVSAITGMGTTEASPASRPVRVR